MRLKYLELYGFKSFAEKTRLDFEDNFVAIVGPNGSGKSNTSDAIRWVLGEQSVKALRGSKMEDVIFSGTTGKKAMNMAQVTIAFDNREGEIPLPYEEVTVSRKVYRSGESQYLINKNPVRRKDVRELFLDTGIGKEGYSIIGQGRIEDILSSRSEDRRQIFEEAAGISKYKYKKEEALRRLEKTQAGLEEISSDLKIKKSEARLLKKQAASAREGVRLSRELDRHELSLLKKNLEEFDQADLKHQAELDRLLSDQASDQEELEAIRQQLLPYQGKLDAHSHYLEEAKDRISSLERELRQREQKQSVRLEQLRFYQRDLDQGGRDREKRSTEEQDYQSRLEKKRREIATLQGEKNQLKSKLETLRAVSNPLEKQWQDMLQVAAKKRDELSQDLFALDFQKKSQEEQDAKLREEQEEKREELRNLQENVTQWSREKENCEEEEQSLLQKLAQGDRERLQEEKHQEDLEGEIENLRRTKSNRESRTGELLHRIRFLQSVMDRYEGYQRSVQALFTLVQKRQDLKKHLLGTVAELVQVKSPYETAMDVALGGALQNVVVPTQEDAKILITLLKDHHIGRITFLPLDSIQGQRARDLHDPKALLPAMKALRYDPRLENVLSHFLANTIFVKQIDDAIALQKLRSGHRFITLEGEVVNSWGSMVGGQIFHKNAGSLLNREKQLEDLEREQKELGKEVATLDQSLRKAMEKREQSRQRRQKQEGDFTAFRKRLDQVRERKNQRTLSLSLAQEQLQGMQQLLSREQIFSSEAYEGKKQQLQEQLGVLDRRLEDLTEKLKDLQQGRQEQEKAKALTESQLEYLQREIELAQNQEADWSDRLQLLREESRQALQQEEEGKEMLIQGRAFLEENEKAMTAAKDALHDWTVQKGQWEKEETVLHEKVKDSLDRKNSLEARLEQLDRQIFQEKMKQEQNRERRALVMDNYRSQYDVEEQVLQDRLSQLVPVETTAAHIQELKQALSKIGYFNFDAIEEYEELKEELDFLTQQIQDLQQSEQDIHQLTRDLNEKMERLFKDSFAKIKKSYNEIFQILFGGGKADLRLDQSDVLTAGIEIVAQPPGKNLQSLDLLSGGERSMTALALLFAIFSIHPTPFCVLDEIDASLDEANIGRYVHYLKALMENTQFIVITHRKTTMELAEMLYGITMEKGLTKVLRLAFEEVNQEIMEQ